MKKRSFSYKAIFSNKISRADLEKLAASGMLTEATLLRLMHVGRYYGRIERIAEGMPAHLKVGDVFTEGDLQRIWLETGEDTVASLGSVQMKLLDLDGLAHKGIQFSDTHIWRLVRAGDFPKPLKIGNRNHWLETEIDDYIADKLKQRDGMEASHA